MSSDKAGMVVDIYDHAIQVVRRAQLQMKPEWALNDKEKRALRHLASVAENSTPIEEEHVEQ